MTPGLLAYTSAADTTPPTPAAAGPAEPVASGDDHLTVLDGRQDAELLLAIEEAERERERRLERRWKRRQPTRWAWRMWARRGGPGDLGA